MQYPDLMRSYDQYKKYEELGHMKMSRVQKIVLTGAFFMFLPLMILKVYYKIFSVKKHKYRIHIFPFVDSEPFATLARALARIKKSKVIVYPKALFVFPSILWFDFLDTLLRKPVWTVRNLDFFAALALKVSKYYGYKRKYGIDRLLLFQEYSFYSSYLTRVFENEKGKVYNLMHGIPGKEACCFRFSKCFVWGAYFKDYYIQNHAHKQQFVIVGSIYHVALKQKKVSGEAIYDIIYAMQGDRYSDESDTRGMLEILLRIQQEKGLKVAVKPHPLYPNKEQIPSALPILELTPLESIYHTKMIVSHFSTMLLDAKVLGKKVLAFLPKERRELVMYLHADEVIFEKKRLCDGIVRVWKTSNDHTLPEEMIDSSIDTLRTIENDIS